MTIENVTGIDGSTEIRWTSDGNIVVKHYARLASGVVLKNRRSILLVEPTSRPDNAVIYDASGSEKVRIRNPLGSRGAFGFTECGYEGDDLTLIIRLPGSEYAYVVDESGEPKNLQEIR